jgi:uncharacterized protein (TIGR03435 family)
MLLMLRNLLADRFKLVMHRETRTMPIYSLEVQNAGKQAEKGLTPTTCVPGAPVLPPANARDAQGRFHCGINSFWAGHLLLTGNTLDVLANRLGSLPVVGRSVVNRTGLDGRFDIELSFTPGSDPGTTPDSVSVFRAVREQLGLKLESARGPVEVLIIDSIERPTPD